MRLIERARRDDGFTLVEMIVAVAILGVLSVALFGIMISYLKVTGTTASRLSESTDQQFVSTYWQTDVSSLGRRSFAPDDENDPIPAERSVWQGVTPPGGCGTSVSDADPVVAFGWTEFEVGATDPETAWTAAEQKVAYVVAASSGGQFVLKRIRCRNDVPDTAITVAHSLEEPPVVACDSSPVCPSDSTLPTMITLTMKVRDVDNPDSDGYTTVLTGDRRQG